MNKKEVRYCWVYAGYDAKKDQNYYSLFCSSDPKAVHLDTIPTPHAYTTARNNVRYIIQSEVQLSQAHAIEVSKTLYEMEFTMPAPKLRK